MARQLSPFAIVLDYCLAANKDTPVSVLRALQLRHDKDGQRSLSEWRRGKSRPVHRKSHNTLCKIEQLYGLPDRLFANLLAADKSRLQLLINSTAPSQQTALLWHMPDDFDDRPIKQQDEIVAWAKANILPCTTDYGRYQSRATQSRYSIAFPFLPKILGGRTGMGFLVQQKLCLSKKGAYGTVDASPQLAKESLLQD
jgi:hypothetical protein